MCVVISIYNGAGMFQPFQFGDAENAVSHRLQLKNALLHGSGALLPMGGGGSRGWTAPERFPYRTIGSTTCQISLCPANCRSHEVGARFKTRWMVLARSKPIEPLLKLASAILLAMALWGTPPLIAEASFCRSRAPCVFYGWY